MNDSTLLGNEDQRRLHWAIRKHVCRTQPKTLQQWYDEQGTRKEGWSSVRQYARIQDDRRYRELMDILLDACDPKSPPERLFATALYLIARDQWTVAIVTPAGERGDLPGTDHLRIEPQRLMPDIGKVDFHLTYTTFVHCRIQGADGMPIEVSVPAQTKLVVECDGKQWHERTDVQAERDRRRDRELQLLHCHCFRFRAAEINTDIHRCVRQTIDALTTLVRPEIVRLERAA